jgi:hypothetical protein
MQQQSLNNAGPSTRTQNGSRSRAKTAAVRRIADDAAAIAVPGRPSASKMAPVTLEQSVPGQPTTPQPQLYRAVHPHPKMAPVILEQSVPGQPAFRFERRAHLAANTCASFLNKKAAFFRKKFRYYYAS